jgi:ubiquinone/menaquinone biosynthesis C-methylase UbiE
VLIAARAIESRRLEDGADDVQESAQMDPEVRAYYESGIERDRLAEGYSRIEYERTKDLLGRHLPPAPARVLDVGGGPGAYAEWLAEAGYDVRLVDPSPLHVRQALERAGGRFAVVEGDAKKLDEPDASHDAVLLLGPLYHLTERDDRLQALREARRVLRPGGVVVAAAISRFASVLDGLYAGYLSDARFWPIVERDLADGQHRRTLDAGQAYFTTAFFHRPDELAAEVEEAGFELEGVFGVEGPGWLLADRWEDATARQNILRAARLLETEPTVVGASSHLLAIGRVP